MYAVYDLKDKEQCIGIFDNCQELADYFNTTKNAIYSLMSHGYKRAGKYEIIKIESENKCSDMKRYYRNYYRKSKARGI